MSLLPDQGVRLGAMGLVCRRRFCCGRQRSNAALICL